MGEGRDKKWSPKFFVLDYEKKRLSFYNSENDTKCRGQMDLSSVLVSNVALVNGRENSFSVSNSPEAIE